MAREIGGVRYEEEYILNSRGMKLFSCRFLPANHEPKALIFLCHGYAAECNTTIKGMGVRLAKQGFGVYGMEYEGHGRSSGLPGYIPSFDDLVTDCSLHYTAISVALLLHRKKPTFWDGAVLVAPMCRPRLKTAKQLLDVSLDLEQRLQEVSLPFLIVHGGDDKVTDPSVSKLLYESACSTDKTFKCMKGCGMPSLTASYRRTSMLCIPTLLLGWMKSCHEEFKVGE
ncbi:hypothetical protein C3L33_16709, partial [Rhododendron williamsianum]